MKYGRSGWWGERDGESHKRIQPLCRLRLLGAWDSGAVFTDQELGCAKNSPTSERPMEGGRGSPKASFPNITGRPCELRADVSGPHGDCPLPMD